jgi:D-alanyl-D-alanine dipeptidase
LLGIAAAVGAGLFSRRAAASSAKDPDEETPVATEDRVRVKDYGSLLGTDERLIALGDGYAKGNLKLHKEVVGKARQLIDEARLDGYEFLVGSAWRPRKWPDRKSYEEEMVRRYGSVAEGRKWVAYESPHETGLAIDLVGSGLTISSKKAASMLKSDAYRWLQKNASRFGFTPYAPEPWHWEAKIDKSKF